MDALKALIDKQREESYREEFRANVSDAEALGLVMAHHFEWDAAQILEAAVSALEDANFHTESAKVQELLDEVMAS